MTNDFNMQPELLAVPMNTAARTSKPPRANPPTHVAKVRTGAGRNAQYERVGVAWLNDKGALYVKLYGTQVVKSLTLYAIDEPDRELA